MKITACVVTVPSWVMQRIDMQGWVWGIINSTVNFVPRAGVLSTSTQVKSWPLSMSFINLALLHTFPRQQFMSPMLTKLIFDVSTPVKGSCEGEAYEVMGWGCKMEKRWGHHVAASEPFTSLIWHVTLFLWVASLQPEAREVAFPNCTAWSTGNASCLMGRGSALCCASEKGI